MCIHGIEEKCVQKSERARVKYSYEPTKKKRRRETVCKERDFGEAKSHIFPSPANFSLFFFCLKEKQRQRHKKGDDEETNQKIPSSKGVCMSILLLCHILLPLIKKRVVCVIFFDFTRFSLASLSSKLLTDIVVFFALVARASFVQRHRDTTR